MKCAYIITIASVGVSFVKMTMPALMQKFIFYFIYIMYKIIYTIFANSKTKVSYINDNTAPDVINWYIAIYTI